MYLHCNTLQLFFYYGHAQFQVPALICEFFFFRPALDLNSDYLKVRLRRAQCFEHEDRLEEALEGKIY